MTTTRILQAAAVALLALALGTPAVAAPLPAAKPPVASTNDMGWQ
ncbi:hypothetical protein [Streptomyces sp. NPDC048269]